MYTIFVLDFDETYNCVTKDSMGVAPLVFLVQSKDITFIKKCAHLAQETFNEECDGCIPIGDYFVESLDRNNVFYQEIGTLKIPFEERQSQYLDNQVSIEII